jgi:hypothetical protein
MGKYKNFKNLLDNPYIFDNIECLKEEIIDCFTDKAGNFVIEGSIDISNKEDAISFYDNYDDSKLFTYNKANKTLLFYDFIDDYYKNNVIKLFNIINNE